MDVGGVKVFLSMFEIVVDDDICREVVMVLVMLVYYGVCCYFCGIVCILCNICKDFFFN